MTRSFRLLPLLAALLCLSVRTARSSVADYSITVWRTEQGLPSDRINAITQTTDGFLWISTSGGLVRFNGTTFDALRKSDLPAGLAGRIVYLASDLQGRLWLSTNRGGVGAFLDGKFTVHIPDGPDPGEGLRLQEIPGGKGMVIISPGGRLFLWDGLSLKHPGTSKALVAARPFRTALDEDGTLWIKTSENKLLTVSGNEIRLVDESWLPGGGSQCTGLVVEKSGRIRLSSERGVATLQKGGLVPDKSSPPECNKLELVGPLPGGGVLAHTDDKQLWRLDGDDWSPYDHYPPPSKKFQTAVTFGASGSIWLAFARHSLVHWSAAGICATLLAGNTLPAADLTFLYEDREGTLWAAANDVGLVRIRRKLISTLTPRADDFDGWGTVGCETGGTQWLGSYHSGLECWRDGKWKRFELSTTDTPASVRSILKTRDGKIWAGTDTHGLFTGGIDGFAPAIPPQELGNQAGALCEDAAGRVWIGNSHGLYILENGRLTSAWDQALSAKPDIRALVPGKNGDLWIAGWKTGLFRRTAAGVIERMGDRDSCIADITCLYLNDAEDRVWIGAMDGLRCWHNGKSSHLTRREGLPDETISHITGDDHGKMWIGTRRGILKVDRTALEEHMENNPAAIEWTIYDESDGLPARQCSPGNQPAGWRTADGKLCFVTYGGMGMIDPNHSGIPALPPAPVIEKVTVGGNEVTSPDDEYAIRPGDERVEILYDMPAPSAPQKTRFRYRLEGYDDAWVLADRRRSADYPSLPAGDYHFHLAACNAAGVWVESAKVLRFKVSVPFWKTAWFAVTAAIAALGLAAGISRHLATRTMRRRVRALKQRQALDAERARIARDLHDDIGSGLTCISLLCGDQEAGHSNGNGNGNTPNGSSSEADIHRIRRIASGMTQTLDEIVWAVSPRHDSLESLATYITGLAQMMLSAAGIRCRLDFPATLPPWTLTADERHHLFLAVKEALHNVVKHSKATSALVSLELESSGFTLSVSDNGCGIGDSPSEGEGLTNMRERLERLGGACRITNGSEGGTSVTLHYTTAKRDYPLHEEN